MPKKNFVRATLSEGKRWVIDYTVWDPDTDEEHRFRKDFGLNKIPDVNARRAAAACLIECVEELARPRPAKRSPDHVTIADALERAYLSKLNLPRANSHKQYKVCYPHLCAWLDEKKALDMPVEQFTRKMALQYWEHLVREKPRRASTLCDYLASFRALWAEMIEQETARENPFLRIKLPRREEKKRRIFTPEERRTVAAYIQETDYWLFRALLLQFYCYVRPREISRLRAGDFDLGRGLVTVRQAEAKTWKKRIATIPREVLPFFTDGTFDKIPANFYVFGVVPLGRQQRMGPSAAPVHENRHYKRHAAVLRRLKEMGRLANIDGLTWYSWKDTGISLHTRKTSPIATRDQAGHSSFDVTKVYYHADIVNAEYSGLPADLLQ